MSDSENSQINSVNIGELLSNKRQQTRESVADVANNLKLSKSVVEKLEANQFADIGVPVYVRGYLEIYAKYLGLDSVDIVEQYNHLFPSDEVVIRPSVGLGLNEQRQKSKRHSKTLSFLSVLMVLGGLTFAYMQAESYWQKNTPNEASKPDNNVATKQENDVIIALQEAKEAQNLANDVLSGDAIASDNALVTDIDMEIALPDATQTGEAAQSTVEGDTASETATSDGQSQSEIQLESIEVGGSSSENNTIAVDENTTSQPESTNAETASISASFRQECWIKVTDANEKTLIAKLYKAGDKLKISGAAPLEMTSGSPRAMTKVVFNNETVDLADYKVGNIQYRFPKNP